MLAELASLQAEYPVGSAVVVFIYGAVAGSFLNVVISRLPVMMDNSWRSQAIEFLADGAQGETRQALDRLRAQKAGAQGEPFNLVVPPSHCPNCRKRIKARENIPIVSYFMLGGKCSNCASPISMRYPLVELATALMTVTVFFLLGFTPAGFAAMLLTWALIAIALIDQDTQLIPDSITLPFLWLGLTCNVFGLYTDISSAVLGCVAGYLALWFVYQAFRAVTGREGLGFGDFKLLAMFGAWLGWQGLPMIILFSSLAGAIVGGILVAFGRPREKPIAFGPYLAIAGWITLLWGGDIMRWYLAFAS